MFFLFFFFNDTATTEIYTLSLHDALPISLARLRGRLKEGLTPWRQHGTPAPAPLWSVTTSTWSERWQAHERRLARLEATIDRKSTRLNSSHLVISYAVFCLKKKTKTAQSD